jgi:hypothetical protein
MADDAILRNTAAVGNYACTVRPQFGGEYVEDGVLVVLFTDRPEEHLARLRALVPFPDALRVRLAERPYDAVKADFLSIRMLLDRHQGIHVTGIGIAWEEGRFLVEIGLPALTTELAAEVRALVAPRPVSVCERPRPRRY